MVSVELGTFVAFLAVPFISLIFLGKIKSWGITGYMLFLGIGALSFIMLGGLTLMMASGYEVVQSNTQTFYNSTGSIIGTTTQSQPILVDNQDIWAWIFLGTVPIFGFIYLKGALTGGP